MLTQLLAKVDALFPKPIGSGPDTYNYTLDKFPRGWRFTLVNNWYAWRDKGFETNFGLYRQPEHAVVAFLEYVREKKINVSKLCHPKRGKKS